jgi:membrane protein involved in colicin uptake
MKNLFSVSSAAAAVTVAFAISSCSTQEEMASKPAAAPAAPPAKAEAKADAKAKSEATTAKAESKGEAKEEAKGEAKAKAEKARGDIGLLDTEKNYLILVTKEGKLITLDYDAKTKATQIDPTPSKMADVGLGSSATVEYTKQGEKNIAKSVEFTPAKGGD